MASTLTPRCDVGKTAPDFKLLGTDGRWHTRDSASGPNGLLIMFICNHCPYVKAIRHRIIRDTIELLDFGIGSIAIMSNDPSSYPEDSWDSMQKISSEFNFPFPYVLDDTQSVARSYGAVCTPDFFGFNRNLQLQYRGRLDSSGKTPATPDSPRELFTAMVQIAQTGIGPDTQTPSIGCSIKWSSE